MDGNYQSKDFCLTKEGAWLQKNTSQQVSKPKVFKGKAPKSCPVCLNYCCGLSPYNGRSRQDGRYYKESRERGLDTREDGQLRQEVCKQVF